MSLGSLLEKTRTNHRTIWEGLFFGFLALLVVLNFFIHPHHVEYVYDKYPGFWAVFGVVVAVIMVLIMKKVVQPLFLEMPEDSEDD